MYKIKQTPEDFIVKEISNIKLIDKGVYSIFLLKKVNYTTEKAVQTIADKLRIKRKFIGYAGNKDKTAITEQLISIKTKNKININTKDIRLEFLGYYNKPISLGDLDGNEFKIIVRNLNEKNINNFNKKIKNNIPNYFGEQRFSKNNIEVGRLIIKRKFREAAELAEIKVKNNDYIGALRSIPKKILKLYIHSYQSYIFNLTVDEIIKNNLEIRDKIPIVGFGTELENNNFKEIISNILKKEKISLRDFIIREIPELTSEGSQRDLYMEIRNLKVLEKSMDKIKLSFKLNKGCYATVAVKYLFS